MGGQGHMSDQLWVCAGGSQGGEPPKMGEEAWMLGRRGEGGTTVGEEAGDASTTLGVGSRSGRL